MLEKSIYRCDYCFSWFLSWHRSAET